jgi:hypothetical protein
MRRDQKLTLRQIAAREGCGVETARRDINRYMAALDAACLEGAAAMRAEEYERLDKLASQLETAIDGGDLSQVPAALKTSEAIRRLYSLDVQPLGRTELAMRRAVISEVASKLRDRLPPETFAEVAILLTDDEPIRLVGDVAVEDGDAPSTQSPRLQRTGSGAAEGVSQSSPGPWGRGVGSFGDSLPMVVSED